MLWSRRQGVLGLLAGVTLGLPGCGFAPAYGPQGSGSKLLNSISLVESTDTNTFDFNQRFEERLGRGQGTPPPYALGLSLQTTTQDTGTTSAGNTNRQRLIGRAVYSLKDSATGATLHEGRTNAFTGYSTTGSTVATAAAAKDAWARLMAILADQVIDDLLLHADDFPA